MLRGFYTASAGMASQMAALDLLSNNIANVNSIGYKTDFEMLVRQTSSPLSYGMNGVVRGTGTLSVRQSLDLGQGSLIQTGRTFDLALQGSGMFAVRSPGGAINYTRDGRFHLDAQRQLVDDSGNAVLSAAGQPMTLPDNQGQTFTVETTGTIRLSDATYGQVGVFDAAGGWQKGGNGLYAPVGAAQVVSSTPVRQGMVENANLDLVRTMGMIMSVQRSYEAATQLQHTEDQILQQSVNDVGRVTP